MITGDQNINLKLKLPDVNLIHSVGSEYQLLVNILFREDVEKNHTQFLYFSLLSIRCKLSKL